MGKRTIKKRRKRVVRIECDHLEYQDEDGEIANLREGQWVEFKRKINSADMDDMLGFGELLGSEDVSEIRAALPRMLLYVARKIVAWNWLDLDGDFDDDGDLPPLPELSDAKHNLDVLRDLDFDDVIALSEMVSSLSEAEKKAPSTS